MDKVAPKIIRNKIFDDIVGTVIFSRKGLWFSHTKFNKIDLNWYIKVKNLFKDYKRHAGVLFCHLGLNTLNSTSVLGL